MVMRYAFCVTGIESLATININQISQISRWQAFVPQICGAVPLNTLFISHFFCIERVANHPLMFVNQAICLPHGSGVRG